MTGICTYMKWLIFMGFHVGKYTSQLVNHGWYGIWDYCSFFGVVQNTTMFRQAANMKQANT